MATTLFFDVTFESAHFLPHVPENHKCRRLHGHNYRVELEVCGPLDPHLGWVVDFSELERLVEPLRSQVDHRLLNDIPGLENPTAEIIAAWFFAHLKPGIPTLVAVWVHENAQSRCRFDGV